MSMLKAYLDLNSHETNAPTTPHPHTTRTLAPEMTLLPVQAFLYHLQFVYIDVKPTPLCGHRHR